MSLLYLFDLSTEELAPCAKSCSLALLFWASGSPVTCFSLFPFVLISASGMSECSESSSSSS